jgi:hypothetical protein
MSLRRILASRGGSVGWRDERTLGLVRGADVVTALLGWVLSEQKEETVRVVVVNEAGQVGDRIVTALTDAAADPERDLEITRTVTTQAEADALIRDGTATIGLVIPADLSDVAAGERPTSHPRNGACRRGRRFGMIQGVRPTWSRTRPSGP